jgi:hypothetical protein
MRFGVALVTAVLALAAVPAAAPGFVPSIVTLDGVGEVRPGRTVAEVERQFGLDLRPVAIGPACTRAAFRSGPVRGRALFVRGRLASLWFDRGVIAGRGIAIGAPFAALRRAYRTLEVRRDPVVRGARDVFVRRTRAPHWRLRFDVSAESRVTRIAFGDQSVYRGERCA